jgi:hypothetical protein
MPIERLHLDTKSAPLDLTPLADIPQLRHLLMVGANVRSLAPIAGKPLESIALSPDVPDVTLLAAHRSLKHIGYRLADDGLLPATTMEEFFQAREIIPTDQPVAGGRPIISFDFDNPAEGTQGWTLQDGATPAPRIYWMSDLAAEGGKGGGYVAFHERKGNGEPAYFLGSPALLEREVRKALYGSMLMFSLRVSQEERDPELGRVEVILRSGSTELHHRSRYRPREKWTKVKVPLEWSAAWTIGPNGPMAAEAVVRSTLERLDEIRIKAEYTTGVPDERTELDGVQIWDKASAETL